MCTQASVRRVRSRRPLSATITRASLLGLAAALASAALLAQENAVMQEVARKMTEREIRTVAEYLSSVR